MTGEQICPYCGQFCSSEQRVGLNGVPYWVGLHHGYVKPTKPKRGAR